jgi:hypothetical protein
MTILLVISLYHETGEEERDQETDSEDALEEEVSEVEENTEYDPEQETTDVEHSSDEEEGPAEVVGTFRSNNGNISWSSSPPERRGRLSAENVIRVTPGLRDTPYPGLMT